MGSDRVSASRISGANAFVPNYGATSCTASSTPALRIDVRLEVDDRFVESADGSYAPACAALVQVCEPVDIGPPGLIVPDSVLLLNSAPIVSATVATAANARWGAGLQE